MTPSRNAPSLARNAGAAKQLTTPADGRPQSRQALKLGEVGLQECAPAHIIRHAVFMREQHAAVPERRCGLL